MEMHVLRKLGERPDEEETLLALKNLQSRVRAAVK